MCGQPPVIISRCIFDEMLSEIKRTRLDLTASLARSEDLLSKLYDIRETSIGLELLNSKCKEKINDKQT
jgi:hypothetical protein